VGRISSLTSPYSGPVLPISLLHPPKAAAVERVGRGGKRRGVAANGGASRPANVWSACLYRHAPRPSSSPIVHQNVFAVTGLITAVSLSLSPDYLLRNTDGWRIAASLGYNYIYLPRRPPVLPDGRRSAQHPPPPLATVQTQSAYHPFLATNPKRSPQHSVQVCATGDSLLCCMYRRILPHPRYSPIAQIPSFASSCSLWDSATSDLTKLHSTLAIEQILPCHFCLYTRQGPRNCPPCTETAAVFFGLPPYPVSSIQHECQNVPMSLAYSSPSDQESNYIIYHMLCDIFGVHRI
jgi:hypothetical protein